MDNQEVNCSVCMESFDEEDHSPRTLRCGHTLCTACIEALLTKCLLERNCPECRKPLKITSASHIPVSYTILRLSSALSTMRLELPSIRVQIEDGEVCMAHGKPITSFCKTCDEWMCSKCGCGHKGSSLMEVPKGLLYVKNKFVDVSENDIEILSSWKDSLEREKDTIDKEISRLQRQQRELIKRLKKVQEFTKKVEDFEVQVVETNSSRKVTKLTKQGYDYSTTVRTWCEEQRRTNTLESHTVPLTPQFPAAQASEVSATNQNHRITVHHDDSDNSEDSQYSDSLGASPAHLVPATLVPSSTHMNLQVLQQKLAITQKMYAVQQKDGKTRWAKLTVHDSNLLLHSLQDTPPCSGATLLPFDEVLSSFLEEGDWTTFLDIENGPYLEGRVFLVMFGRTGRARNFYDFCLGLNSRSYRDVELCVGYFKSETCGRQSSVIQAGGELAEEEELPSALVDYGFTDGGYYSRAIHPGLLSGFSCSDPKLAPCFSVHLFGLEDIDDFGFGKVTSGLDVLRQSYFFTNRNRGSCCIAECGVVKSLRDL